MNDYHNLPEREELPELDDDQKRDAGVRCPKCECRHCPTVRGAIRHLKSSTRRQRRCRHCGRTFWTTEAIISDES